MNEQDWYLESCEMLGRAFGKREVISEARAAFDASLRHADREIAPNESQEIINAIEAAKHRGLEVAMEEFLASEDYDRALASSTRSDSRGVSNRAVVELFINGTWRLLDSGQVENLYYSDGRLLEIPSMGPIEYESDFESALGEAVSFEIREGEIARGLQDSLAERLRSNDYVKRCEAAEKGHAS